jgi:holo-[acyl-carrier protein] synthase
VQTPRIGHDLVDIPRFERALERREAAWQRRVFTEGEWDAAGRRPDRAAVLAARFAAKEATFKALGTGWGQGVAWLDVEVVGGGRSAPSLVLRGKALEIVETHMVSLQLSLSHTDRLASAMVLAFARTDGS